ncbi:MAG: hypothetical protein KDA93_10725 [Planctomycetaceae bacterium]|nr:hypothetical protein [Planctomycetaceae bacterium]
MNRQLFAALILTATTALVSSPAQAGCHGGGCHTGYGYGINTIRIDSFHARFGCSPREAFLFFRQHPEQMVRFPEAVKILEAQFGQIVTTTTPATTVTPAVTATETPAVAGTPAVVETPAVDAAAVTTPAEVAPVTTPEVAAPAIADPATADPAAPQADLPVDAPAQSELEPLLGLWVNENDSPDQPIAKINLVDVETAKVTVNTDLGQTEVTKSFALEDGTVKLDGEAIGSVVSADADKVVLNSNGSEITLVRP